MNKIELIVIIVIFISMSFIGIKNFIKDKKHMSINYRSFPFIFIGIPGMVISIFYLIFLFLF